MTTAARSSTAVTRQAPPAVAELPCEERSAQLARGLVRARLGHLGLAALVEDAELVVSELVGNSVRHCGGRRIRVAVRRRLDGRVRISVEDACRTPPTLLTATEDDECHRGLALVDTLADRWGTAPTACGKVTWADLR
ncbi:MULTISPECIES: ATP-binding protein [Kitasatospora]|uniref:Histidine kinase/HSP90-like ATPase domain-containing protein n=1 Tax=Kitasatospora arboriphila TaxID=258052 RepID=A0ABN1TA69_9ACTN